MSYVERQFEIFKEGHFGKEHTWQQALYPQG